MNRAVTDFERLVYAAVALLQLEQRIVVVLLVVETGLLALENERAAANRVLFTEEGIEGQLLVCPMHVRNPLSLELRLLVLSLLCGHCGHDFIQDLLSVLIIFRFVHILV